MDLWTLAESAKPTPPTGGISQPATKAGGRRNQPPIPDTWPLSHQPRQPAESASQPASQPASAAAGGISQPCPTPQPSANNRRNQSASQPASHPASQPARRPAESASQLQQRAESASQPASQRGGRRNQPVMPQTTCRSRRPAESATSPSGGRRNQPKLPAGGRRNQPDGRRKTAAPPRCPTSSMLCVARSRQSHRQKLVKGHPSVLLDVMMAEIGCHEIRTPAFVHKLLDWKGHAEPLRDKVFLQTGHGMNPTFVQGLRF